MTRRQRSARRGPLRHREPLRRMDVDGVGYCYECGRRLERVSVTVAIKPIWRDGRLLVQRTTPRLIHQGHPFPAPGRMGC